MKLKECTNPLLEDANYNFQNDGWRSVLSSSVIYTYQSEYVTNKVQTNKVQTSTNKVQTEVSCDLT